MKSHWTSRLLLLAIAAVLIPACGSSSSGGAPTPVSSASIDDSLTPDSVAVDGSFTIFGEGFSDQSEVLIDGVLQTVTFVSPTEITVDVVVATPPGGALDLVVEDASGVPSVPVSIYITSSTASITPDTVSSVYLDYEVTIEGTGFPNTPIVHIGGVPQNIGSKW